MLDTVVGTGHTLMNTTNVVPSLALSFPSQIEFLTALTTLCHCVLIVTVFVHFWMWQILFLLYGQVRVLNI